jgi:hypothetical protein
MSKGPWNPPTSPLLLLADLEEESAAHLYKLAQLSGHRALVYRTQAKQAGAKATPQTVAQQGDDALLHQSAIKD